MEDEFEPVGEIGWYASIGHGNEQDIKWIWAGMNKTFVYNDHPRAAFGGKPYRFQYPLNDVQTVYIKKRKE